MLDTQLNSDILGVQVKNETRRRNELIITLKTKETGGDFVKKAIEVAKGQNVFSVDRIEYHKPGVYNVHINSNEIYDFQLKEFIDYMTARI